MQQAKKLIKFIKEYWHWLVLLLAGCVYIFVQLPYNRSMQNTSEVVGEIILGGYKTVSYKYSVRDVEYPSYQKNTGIISDYVIPGDEFVIVHSNNEPLNHQIYFNKPVISDSLYIKTKSVRHEFFGTNSFIRFWYEVNGEVYKRVQYLEDRISSDDIKEYEVMYPISRPDLGLICVDDNNCYVFESNLNKSDSLH